MRHPKYGRPNMNNLPYELGKAIFEEMDKAPKTDWEKRRKEALELQERMIEARNKENSNA